MAEAAAAQPPAPGSRSFTELLDEAAEWRRQHGVEEPSEEEATALAVEVSQEVRREMVEERGTTPSAE